MNGRPINGVGPVPPVRESVPERPPSESDSQRSRHSSSSTTTGIPYFGPRIRAGPGPAIVCPEVLSEPVYDAPAEIRSRFDTLPLPPAMKQYLMMSR